MNNVGIFCTPQKDDPEDGPMFIAGIAEGPDADADGRVDFSTLLPSQWDGQYAPHFVKCDQAWHSETETIWDTQEFKARQISHVVMVEGPVAPKHDGDPYWFGGETIRNASVILWYSEERKTYLYFHCARCAMMTLNWITQMQEKWHALSSSTAQASCARH